MNHWVPHPSTGSGHAIYGGFLSAQRIKKVILSGQRPKYSRESNDFTGAHPPRRIECFFVIPE